MGTTDTTLPELVAEVSAALQRIDKRGTAPQSMGGFAFVRITDVMDKLKPELDSRGIVLRPLYRQVGEPIVRERERGYSLLLTVELELWALRKGEELLLARTIGMGADTQDKASGKAQSSAMKEAILRAFAIPTGDDPEDHDQIETRPRQSQQRRAETRSAPGSAPRGGASKGEAIATLNALLKSLDELESQTANRYSVRAHVRKEYGHDTVGELISKGTDEQLRQLIAYVSAKLKDPGEAAAGSAEAMSDEDAIRAGAALAGRDS